MSSDSSNKALIILLLLIIVLLFVGIVFFVMRKPSNTNSNNLNQVQESSTVVQTSESPASCTTKYLTTEESKVVMEESPVLITGIEKKCDGNYYVTVDYLGPAQGNAEAGDGSYYTNANLKLRTFKVGKNFSVQLAGNEAGVATSIDAYLTQLVEKTFQQPLFGRTVVYLRSAAPSPVYSLKVQQGVVIKLDEVYLP